MNIIRRLFFDSVSLVLAVAVILIIIIGIIRREIDDSPIYIINTSEFWVFTHFGLWFVLSAFPSMDWISAIIIMLGWEVIEVIFAYYTVMLPFIEDGKYFNESVEKKLADVVANISGFYLGRKYFGTDKIPSKSLF